MKRNFFFVFRFMVSQKKNLFSFCFVILSSSVFRFVPLFHYFVSFFPSYSCECSKIKIMDILSKIQFYVQNSDNFLKLIFSKSKNKHAKETKLNFF